MDEIRLTEIEARANAASAPPWKHGPINYADIYSQSGEGPIVLVVKGGDDMVANAGFIIGARQDIPDLIAEIRQLRADLEWLAMLPYSNDHLHLGDGKYHWCYDHTNAGYASIHEAIAAKRGAEVSHA